MFATTSVRVKTYNEIVQQLTYLPDDGLLCDQKHACLDILTQVHVTPRQTIFDRYVLDLSEQQYAALRHGKEILKEYNQSMAQKKATTYTTTVT